MCLCLDLLDRSDLFTKTDLYLLDEIELFLVVFEFFLARISEYEGEEIHGIGIDNMLMERWFLEKSRRV